MRILLFIFTLLVSLASNAVERVVSLAPSSTELAYAVGLGDKLVAASAYSDYPEQAKKLERVADFNGVNVERIIALNPDLIIAWRSGGSLKHLTQLKELGFNIYYTDTTYLADIANRLDDLSQFADDPTIGQKAAKLFRQRLAQLKKENSHNSPISYFYQLSSDPIITIANNAWPSEVFSLCNGKNIFQESPIRYPQVGIEQVLQFAPEIIFTSPHTIQNTKIWQPWKEQIPAVKHNFIWSLNSDWVNRPTPRSLQAAEQVCAFFDQARNKINSQD